jgi:hypothetical protein
MRAASGTMCGMTLPNEGAPRKRLWLPLVGLLGIAIAIIAAISAFAVLRSVFGIGTDLLQRDPVKDGSGHTVVLQRLSAAKGDLNAVADPPNSEAISIAKVFGCSVDSGEVFEPELYREWRLLGPAKGTDSLHTTEPAKAVARRITKALIARGWAGSAELDQYASTDLTKSFNGHQISLSIQVDGESVLAVGDTPYKRVCRSHV